MNRDAADAVRARPPSRSTLLAGANTEPRRASRRRSWHSELSWPGGRLSSRRTMALADVIDVGCPAGIRARQPEQGQRAEQQTEVAERDVRVAADQEQTDDDAAEPGC